MCTKVPYWVTLPEGRGHMIRKVLVFVMREFRILFSITCDGSIRDVWCVFQIYFSWGVMKLPNIRDLYAISIFKMRLFAVDAGRDLWFF